MLDLVFLFILLAVEVVVVFWMTLVFVSGVSSSFHGAPFVPIKGKLVKEILVLGEPSEVDSFYDLGCGDGRVLISAVQDFSVKKAIGYEVSWWPYWIARHKIRRAGLTDKIEIYRKNFFDADLSMASVIYMYLFPKLVNRLAEKIVRECRSGTKIICPSFPIDTITYPQFRLLKTQKIATITVYLYKRE